MGAATSGVNETTASRGTPHVDFGCFIRFVAAVLMVLSLLGAATGPTAQNFDGHEAAGLDHSTDSSHDAIVCEDGIICSPFFLSPVAATATLLRRTGPGAAGCEHPFLRFTSPQVDLPPPRNTA